MGCLIDNNYYCNTGVFSEHEFIPSTRNIILNQKAYKKKLINHELENQNSKKFIEYKEKNDNKGNENTEVEDPKKILQPDTHLITNYNTHIDEISKKKLHHQNEEEELLNKEEKFKDSYSKEVFKSNSKKK